MAREVVVLRSRPHFGEGTLIGLNSVLESCLCIIYRRGTNLLGVSEPMLKSTGCSIISITESFAEMA